MRSLLPRVKGMGAGGVAALLVSLLLSLRVATWFSCPRVTLSGDLRLVFSPSVADARYMYFLDEVDLGLPSPYPFRIFNPLELLVFLLVKAGLDSPCLVEAIAVYIVSVLAFMASYAMFRELTGSVSSSIVASFYLLSVPFMVIDREISAIIYTYTMLTIGLSTYLLLAAARGSRVAAVLYPLTLLLAVSRYPNLRLLYLTLFWQAMALLYLYVDRWLHARYSRGVLTLSIPLHPVASLAARLSVPALLSIIVLAPIAAFTIYNMEIFTREIESLNLAGKRPDTGLLDVFRMLYMWSFTGYDRGLDAYFVPYHEAYYTVPMIMVTLIASIGLPIAGALLWDKPRRTRILLVLYLALLYSLVMGPSLYGGLYTLLVESLVIAPFRNTQNWYYLVALASALLVAGLASGARARWGPRGSTGVAVLVVIVSMAAAFPLYTGDVATNWLDPSQGKGYLVDYGVYRGLDEVLSSVEWSLMMPPTGTYVVFKDGDMLWSFGNPYVVLLSKPVITGVGSEYMKSPYQDSILEYLRMASQGSVEWLELSKVWGVGSVAVSRGLDHYKPQLLLKGVGYDEAKRSLEASGARPAGSIGFIDLYRIDSYPMLYAADKVVPYTGGLEGMAGMAAKLRWYDGMVAFIDARGPSVASPTCGSDSINWIKVSPVEYRGQVTCSGRLLIVLLTGYSDDWVMELDGGRVLDHVRVNHVMNGWVVDAGAGASFTIKYKLHYDMVRILQAASLLYALVAALYLYWDRIRALIAGG